MKAMKFQEEVPSIPIDTFGDQYVLVFALTSRQDATGNCHYLGLAAKPLRPELNLNFPLKYVTELFASGERMSLVANVKFGVVERNI